MKKILFLIAIYFMGIGCGKDNTVPANPLPDTDLKMSDILQQIPFDLLSQEPTAVFVNALGNEVRFTINYTRESKARTFNSNPYTAEKLQADYQEIHPSGLITLSIFAKIEYDLSKQITEYMGVNLNTAHNNGFVPFIVIDHAGNVSFGSTLEFIDIAGYTYYDVYSNYIRPTEFTSFTKLYYTKDLGIIGYEGLDGEMWALDRYE